MGTIYWQLNDVWPAVSWSSLDYFLAWKTLHYHARRFFAPVATASRIEDGRLIILAVSDRHQSVPVAVRMQKVSFDGRMLAEETAEATVPAERAVRVWSFDAPPGDNYFLVVDARVGGDLGYDSMLRTVVLPDKPKRFEFPEAKVTIEPVARRPDAFAFTADRPAFYVRPEAPGVRRRLRRREFPLAARGEADGWFPLL